MSLYNAVSARGQVALDEWHTTESEVTHISSAYPTYHNIG